MMILSDQDGKDVDDCFGANMGGKKAYLDSIRQNRGTIIVSPGYAENWQRRQSQKGLATIIEQVENMRFVFERMEYSTVVRLENGLGARRSSRSGSMGSPRYSISRSRQRPAVWGSSSIPFP